MDCPEASGHSSELTRVIPFELGDAVLEETRTRERRLRALPSRVGIYFVLAMCLFPGTGYRDVRAKLAAALSGQAPGPSARALRDLRRRIGLALLDLAAQFQQHLRDVDLDRTHLAARATQAGSERQSGLVRYAHELRRDDGADGSRVHPRKAVAADLAVHRAGVQTRAAADAVQRLPLGAVGQQLGAPVVEQHDVKLFRPITRSTRH